MLGPKSGILLGVLTRDFLKLDHPPSQVSLRNSLVLTDIIPGTFGDPAINAIPTSPGTTIGLVLLDGVTFPLLSSSGLE